MSDTFHINVSGDVLVWARNSIAYTKNGVEEKTGINAKRITQLESGERQPTLEELRLLSKTYKRTIATLLLENPPKEKPLPKDRRTIDSKELETYHERTIMAVRKARALAQSSVELRNEMGLPFPKFSLSAQLDDDPKNVAREIRSKLRLNELRDLPTMNLALEGYIEKVEALGIAVFQLSLTQDGLRGFAIVDDIVPIIGLKRGGEQPHSKIFTLFHELGHVLLNDGGLCDLSFKTTLEIEKWCNAFAGEILIPSEELLRMGIIAHAQHNDKKAWAKKELVELGAHFHVGPLAMLRSLLENGLTSKSFYRSKHDAWNKPSFGRAKHPEGRNIAKETIREKGRTYISLAFKAFDQNRINVKDLSDFLGVKLSYIPKTRQLLNG